MNYKFKIKSQIAKIKIKEFPLKRKQDDSKVNHGDDTEGHGVFTLRVKKKHFRSAVGGKISVIPRNSVVNFLNNCAKHSFIFNI